MNDREKETKIENKKILEQRNKRKHRKKRNVTNGPTDQQRDRAGHRVACTRLKMVITTTRTARAECNQVL